MKVWEAYCDIKLRNTFKHEYLAAQGFSPSKAQDIMTKFKIYIDRFNGSPDILEIREINNVPEIMEKIDCIFHTKWQNHIKDNYRIMPEIFAQYGRYLQAENVRRDVPLFETNEIPPNYRIEEQQLSQYELPYIGENGKLNIIANPLLISTLKNTFKNKNIIECLNVVKVFYGSQLKTMTNFDWQRLIQVLFGEKKKKDLSRTGAKKSKIHLKMADVVDQVMQPVVALGLVINFIGKEKVSNLRLELKGMPLVTKNIPYGKEKFYCSFENGWFLNTSGDTKEKMRVIRMLSSIFKIDTSPEIVL